MTARAARALRLTPLDRILESARRHGLHVLAIEHTREGVRVLTGAGPAAPLTQGHQARDPAALAEERKAARCQTQESRRP